ncbi:uncharacterized protein LOC132973503 [Labrus mixtus]|uniref:uncharacterized protein LOC132973503 n=1 Tax=Labrus mixtus TaxID=508554 RepID=UPI0029BFBF67|nr:uncharacterized protein LOC132973503 [Labrus mixtus]
MDLCADSGTLSTHAAKGGPALEEELSFSSNRSQTGSGNTILLQLLEFKTHLLEIVEELQIQRDAKTLFEDQISKLVLENQELEWEKASLQHQTETVTNQHTEALMNAQKQFQAKISNIEEEKGIFQISAELKDKEMINLKEAMKSLQMLKYNLEKKANELEQKLALQNRSKDSHLIQLGEVEKRFSALSRQCNMVKQAHEKLEQNVDEAMKMNTKLTSANGKQISTIISLKKGLEEVSSKLIKTNMSTFRNDKTQNPTGTERCLQQLHQKLNMETEVVRKIREENLGLREDKQEVMRSLQHTHQLLLSQTQTVSKVEMELQTCKQQYQDLKQEHELMQEKSKAMENKVAHLMESSISSKTSWDKEKAVFLDHIKSQHQDLQAVREAYDKIKQEHSKLLLESPHLNGLKRRDSRHCQNYNSQHFPTSEERIDELISESDLPALQNLASTKTKNRDSPEDTEAKLITTEEIRGQDVRNPTQQFQFKQHLNPLNLLTFPLTSNNLVGLCSPNGTACIISNEHLNVSTSKRGSNVGSDLNSSSSFSEDGLQISKTVFCSVKDSSTASCLDNGSIDESLDSLSQDVNVEGKGTEQNQGWINDMNKGKKDREESNREQQYSKKEVHREDVKGGGTDGLQRGMIITQRTGRVDRQEDSQQSSEDAGDSKQPGTATRDRKEEERTNGAEETEKSENQIDAQMTTYTTTEKSNPQQDLNIMDVETLLPACVPSDCSQKVSEKDVDSSYVTTGYEIHREQQSFSPNEHQCINHWPNDLIQEVQLFCHDEVKSFAQDALPPTQMMSLSRQMLEETQEGDLSNKSAGHIPNKVSDALNQPSMYSSQNNVASLVAQLDCSVSIQESESAHIQPSNLSNTKRKDKMSETNLNEECGLVRNLDETQALSQIQETQDKERAQLLTDYRVDSNAYEQEAQPNIHIEANNVSDAAMETKMNTYSCHKKICIREDAGDAVATNWETDWKPYVNSSHVKDASSATKRTPANEPLLDIESTYRPAHDWSIDDRTVNHLTKSDGSVLHQFVQESRASLSVSSLPVSSSSHTVSRLLWQTTPVHGRAPTSTAGPSLETDWETSHILPVREDQHSFRAQISKIEQFLNTDRRRTDN